MIQRVKICPRNPHQYRRSGISNIEVLVAIAVIGILVAILVPAVQQTRETSRRTMCMNHLRQIGTAIHSFEGERGRLPKSGTFTKCSFFGGGSSVHSELLPWLDQSVLARAVEDGCPYPDPLVIPAVPGEFVDWVPVAFEKVPVFLCPSDPTSDFGNNYRACQGSMSFAPADGAFGWKESRTPITASDIRDGLSATAAFSEKIKSPYSSDWNPLTDFWFTGLWDPQEDYPPAEQLIQVCKSPPDQPIAWQTHTGMTWLTAEGTFTEYRHMLAPNSSIPDCDLIRAGPGDLRHPSAISMGTVRATSYHPGGVNLLLLDGHVRFIANEIDLDLWRALGTRDGSEVAALPQF